MEVDSRKIGVEARKNLAISLTLNTKEIERGLYGCFHWRKYWLHFFLWVASLAFNIELTEGVNENGKEKEI